jgi:uncharacterized membrane protein YkvA (DUF1232 family)
MITIRKLIRGGTYLRILPLIPQLPNFVRLGWRLLRDHRVPLRLKGMAVLGLLYAFSPFDILPDFLLPGVGYVDDVTLLLLIGYYLIRWSPQEVVEEHVAAMGGSFAHKFQQWWSRYSSRAARTFSTMIRVSSELSVAAASSRRRAIFRRTCRLSGLIQSPPDAGGGPDHSSVEALTMFDGSLKIRRPVSAYRYAITPKS